jgi:hypothetical protein
MPDDGSVETRPPAARPAAAPSSPTPSCWVLHGIGSAARLPVPQVGPSLGTGRRYREERYLRGGDEDRYENRLGLGVHVAGPQPDR